MRAVIVCQVDVRIGCNDAVHSDLWSRIRLGIHDAYVVLRVAITVVQFISRPLGWYVRCDVKPVALSLDAEYGFSTQTIHPTGRTGVPGPSSPADVWRNAVDVGGYHERFHTVAVGLYGRIGVVNGIQDIE